MSACERVSEGGREGGVSACERVSKGGRGVNGGRGE